MKVELIAWTPNPTEVIEQAASTCYDSKPGKGNIMKACLRNGHTSVAEHVLFTFRIDGVSRALMAQLTRHRAGTAFSIRSQRYCDEGQFGFVVPQSIMQSDAPALSVYDDFMALAQATYQGLIDYGIPKEDARFVLPNACETSITFSCNLRELIHICHERLCNRAQWEFRKLANAMRDAVVCVMPEADEFLAPKCEAHKDCPFCPESHGCGKHPPLKDVYKAEK